MARKKILLVDDSTTSLFMEQMILKREPYDLSTANDGIEALEKAFLERPDLILMDVTMPRMNGFEALKRLRKEAATRQTPVILVTARSEPLSLALGHASGCSDTLTKPIDPEELLTKVRSWLGGLPGGLAH